MNHHLAYKMFLYFYGVLKLFSLVLLFGFDWQLPMGWTLIWIWIGIEVACNGSWNHFHPPQSEETS